MRLLFAYIDYHQPRDGMDCYHGMDACGLNFSTAYDFYVTRKHVEEDGENEHECAYRLTCDRKPRESQLPDGFWGERIYNISALVGENGTGKSTLLIGVIKTVVKGLDPGVPYLLVIQRTGSQELVVYHSKGLDVSLERDVPKPLVVAEVTDYYPEALKKMKAMLVDNSLTLASVSLDKEYSGVLAGSSQLSDRNLRDMDILAPSPVYESDKQLCNKSLAASIRFSNDMSIAGQRIQRNIQTNDELESHFLYESYQEARFLFDPFVQKTIKELRGKGHPFPCPTYLYVIVREMHWWVLVEGGKNVSVSEDHWSHSMGSASFEVADFLGLILANALRILYKVCNGTSCEDHADWLIDNIDLGDSPAEFYRNARHIIEPMAEEVRLIPQNNPGVAGGTRASIADLLRFIKYIIENEEELGGVFLPCAETAMDNQGTHTCRMNIEEVLDDPEKRKCVSEFLGRYRLASGTDYFLLFSAGLSSGEKSLLQLITHFRYVLAGPVVRPEDSKPGDYEPDTLRNWFPALEEDEREEEVTCDTLMLFLDEADLTYHPEWQRQFVRLITAILPRMFRNPYGDGGFEGCKDIQVILTTHSPLLLSDIPQQSCVFLQREGKRNVTVKNPTARRTFGTNVQDLLRSAFFLKRTIGEFAHDKIVEEVFEELSRLANGKDGADCEKCRQYRQVIDMVGDPILRNKLMSVYDRCFPVDNAKLAIQGIGRRLDDISGEERKELISSLEGTLAVLRQGGGSGK